jgi:phosphate transport system protein
MVRDLFDQQLQQLQEDVLAMGSKVEEALSMSVETLKQKDLLAARRIIAGDREINAKRFEIEEAALTLIATQQPMAGDMRLLAAVLEIITELERIGDYAKGIARINLMIGEQPFVKPLIDLPLMASKARAMLQDALDAFINQDLELARAVPPRDQEVDDLYNQVYRELLSYIMEDPSTIEQANLLLWVAHNLERTADRTINLCERIAYMITGEMKEFDSDEAGVESLG